MILHALWGGGNSFSWGFPFVDIPNAFLLIVDTLFTIYRVKAKFAHGVSEPEAISIVDQSINSWSLSLQSSTPHAVSCRLFLLLLAFLEHLLHDLLLFYQERSYNPILHAVCTS